jgi:uncharacterized NAD(P)/FAD-binding protein YdhS
VAALVVHRGGRRRDVATHSVFPREDGSASSSETTWRFNADGTASRLSVTRNFTAGLADAQTVDARWEALTQAVRITYLHRARERSSSRIVSAAIRCTWRLKATSGSPLSLRVTASEQLRAQVIIVGGGPAGAATAYYLARAGVDVLVLDRRDSRATSHARST